MDVMTLASRHRDWLATRQSAVATNIANANTPGFKALEVQSFGQVLRSADGSARAAVSHPRHLSSASAVRAGQMEQAEDTGIVTHSGNSVNLEAELQAAGAVKREYSLNVAVARAFRRMVMASLRG
jgi:flagellar basal-body rod protein FlgB